MPYKTVSEAEKDNTGLKKYSDKAKRGWLGSFNSCMNDGGPESKCFAIAYSVANKVDGKQPTTKKSSDKVAGELLKIAKELVAEDDKLLMKKGQWYLYDSRGYASDFRDWRRGPKYVRVLAVKGNPKRGFTYVLESYDEIGNPDEKKEFYPNAMTDIRDYNKLDNKWELVSRPKFKKPAPEMDVREIENLAKRHLRWFDEGDQPLSWDTRQNGNITHEEAGEEDIDAAYNFAKAMKRVPGADVDIEVVDEWVMVKVKQLKSM